MRPLIENKDFELTPSEDPMANWHIRILEGDFVETVVEFTVLRLKKDQMTFDYNIVSTPNEDLVEQDPDLILYMTRLLEAMLERIEAGENVPKPKTPADKGT